MTSEKRAQKFHRYWWRLTTQIWIVLLILLKQIFSQSDALSRSGWYRVITIEFLRPFLRRHFVGKPVEASRNMGYFLRLNTIWLWMKFKPISNGEIFEWIIMKIHISNGRVKKEIMTTPINLPFSRQLFFLDFSTKGHVQGRFLKVDFHCRVILHAYASKIYARK